MSAAVFQPADSLSTFTLTVGPTATAAPVALGPLAAVSSYRVRNPAASASPITWTLSTSNATAPVIPTPYSTAGTGGSSGNQTIDAGGVEVFALTLEQKAALAAGTLYLRATTPPAGSGTLSITFGIGM